MRGHYDCAYCGETGTSFDHVVPWTWRRSTKAGRTLNKKTCVGCCHECNSLLGNLYLHTIAEKAEYISERLAIRYKDILSLPSWSEEELEQMGDTQKSYIRRKQLEKQIVMDRIRHANSVSYLEEMTIEDYWDKQSFDF